MSLPLKSLAEWRDCLRDGSVSSVELVNMVADAIDKEDGATHAYLSYDRDAALKIARNVSQDSLLAGIPIGVKDNISVKGQPTR